MLRVTIFWSAILCGLMFLLFFPPKSLALSCVEPPAIESYLSGQEQTLDSFIIVRIVDHDSEADEFTLHVKENLIGPYLTGNIEVIDQGADFGDMNLNIGSDYLLQVSHEKGELVLSPCEAHQPVTESQIDYYKS